MTVDNKQILETFKPGEIVEVDGQLIDPELLKYRSKEYSIKG